MINEASGYSGIVQQISAVRSALDRVTEVIVQDLLEYCISQTTDMKGKGTAREKSNTRFLEFYSWNVVEYVV